MPSTTQPQPWPVILQSKTQPILNNASIVPLYWGSSVAFNYDGFYAGFLNSSFGKILTQYNITGASTQAGITNLQGEIAGTVNASAVVSYVRALLRNGQLNSTGGNLYIPVHFASGVTVNSDEGGQAQGTHSCVDWCAYHSFIGPAPNVYFGILPDMTFAKCSSYCKSQISSNLIGMNNFGKNTQMASRILANTITDPYVNYYIGPFGYVDNFGREIGDKCSKESASATQFADGNYYYVTKLYDNSTSQCAGSPPLQSANYSFASGSKNKITIIPGNTTPANTSTNTSINFCRLPWNATKAYNPNVIVSYLGFNYMSLQNVPENTDITNNFWKNSSVTCVISSCASEWNSTTSYSFNNSASYNGGLFEPTDAYTSANWQALTIMPPGVAPAPGIVRWSFLGLCNNSTSILVI
ncbi:hypothetical protein BC830DRAFT_1155119 [Chytriomyces sp. MP71]|nr:hypothetical protein BC830DRAFT_1155119 [Chytriomyces sp. MP71]